MNETPETTPAEPGPQVERDWGKIGMAVVAVAVLLLILWLAFAVRGANIRAAERETEARRVGAFQAATSLAAAVEPLLDLRSRGEAVDDQTLQRVCQNLAGSARFELVAIADESGTVIASTDLMYLGSPFPDVTAGEPSEMQIDGVWQVGMPVTRGNILFGSVIVRTRVSE